MLLINKLQYMKNLTFLFALFLFFGCSDDDTSSDNTESNLIIYKNQTGDNNADALQAQYKDLEGTLNFYGNFDEELNPTTIRTLTYQKSFNDTIVNLIIDPLTNKLASSYTTVNGIKSDVVMKFDYPSDESLSVSVHEYDWNTMTSDIIYGVNLDRPNGDNAGRNSYNFTSNWEVVGVIAAVAEVGFFIEGGLAATFTGPIALALVESAVALAIANPVSAIGIAIGTVALFVSSDAFSGELEPSDLPYPEDTEIENPVTTEEDPTPTLEPFECAGVPISFELIMDQDGTIVLTEVNGSEGPYAYAVGEDIRDYPIFPNDYENDFYLACVKDANDCISCRGQNLIRPTACDEDTFEIVITTTSNSATAGVSGGEPPYVYLWSNGSNGPTATNLTEGTYTVSITDQNGCTNTADAVINEIDLTGEWTINLFCNLDGGGYTIAFNEITNTITLIDYPSYEMDEVNSNYELNGNNLSFEIIVIHGFVCGNNGLTLSTITFNFNSTFNGSSFIGVLSRNTVLDNDSCDMGYSCSETIELFRN